jgi:hypothetical protein
VLETTEKEENGQMWRVTPDSFIASINFNYILQIVRLYNLKTWRLYLFQILVFILLNYKNCCDFTRAVTVKLTPFSDVKHCILWIYTEFSEEIIDPINRKFEGRDMF